MGRRGAAAKARPPPAEAALPLEPGGSGGPAPPAHPLGAKAERRSPLLGCAAAPPPPSPQRALPMTPKASPSPYASPKAAPAAPPEVLPDEAYYSEPERELMRSPSRSDFGAPGGAGKARPSALTAGCLEEAQHAPAVALLQAEAARFRRAAGAATPGSCGAQARRQPSESRSPSCTRMPRRNSEPLFPGASELPSGHARDARLARWRWCCRWCCRRPAPAAAAAPAGRPGGAPGPAFLQWLADEVHSRPVDETQQLPGASHLAEVAKVPKRLEKLLIIGDLLCCDIVLHELSFTPLQAAGALLKLPWRYALKGSPLRITELGDLIRLSLLLLNLLFMLVFFDVSWMYHYIRGESFLKLYVIFNMLEMFERWARSVGVDLFDVVMASAQQQWSSLLPKYLATLAYCCLHSCMHLVRVLLLQVAINTSSSAVFLIIVTNNFAEIKSTVFKRYEAKSLFPIIASDIVERFYLLTDVIFVLARLSISTGRGTYSGPDIAFWLFLLVILEVGTDWIKFCLIIKFSELPASVLEVYKEVLIADVLLCRTQHIHGAGSAKMPAVPFRGISEEGQSRPRPLSRLARIRSKSVP
ncbi:unnamed protein product, partial [Prorocentrum cordatum]